MASRVLMLRLGNTRHKYVAPRCHNAAIHICQPDNTFAPTAEYMAKFSLVVHFVSVGNLALVVIA